MPVVDGDGRYHSLLHYHAFAGNLLERVNPHKKTVIQTSVHHLLATLKAQPILAFDEERLFKAMISVAASTLDGFRSMLDAEPADNMLVLVGDREDVQRYAIERGVRALIITNGKSLGKGLKELAGQRRVSVMSSPFDTSSTALLIIYSTPVRFMGDATVRPVHRRDAVRKLRPQLAAAVNRCLPVVDDDGRVTGLLAEGDLINEPNIQLILVDHNELSQAVEGVENYRILEVLDHHRLGTFATPYPITFINRPVGATSTLVAGLYREHKVPLPRNLAALLLCGILSDTLLLQSATTTDADRAMADYLATIADLDLPTLGRDILGTASQAGKLPIAELLRLDRKEYREQDLRFAVSQVEVTCPDEIMGRHEPILAALAAERQAHGYRFAALMVTDITQLTSYLFIAAERDLLTLLTYPRTDQGAYILKDLLSRKKQLVPLLLELAEKAG
jgi:manganese-dependent inorganic pyrophosphatase